MALDKGARWTMKAAAYVRVSSESQIDTWSIPAQKRELEEYCRQKGWQLVQLFSEEGISAHSDSIEKRPQFRRLLEGCKKAEYEVVLVHSLDRWSRNLRVTLESFKLLADNRIAFVSITENIDYSSPEGRLFLAMLGAFAQYFSDSLSKHTVKGMRQRAMSGLHNGDVPFGYERCTDKCNQEHNGKVHIIEKEAEAVKKLFNLYANNGWCLSKLANWMNEEGFRTRNKGQVNLPDGTIIKGPRPFTLYSISGLLHNPFFAGKIKYKGQLYNGVHEAIVDEALFDKVQHRLSVARSRTRTYSASFRPYLLKGIARCIYCGYPLWSETNTKNLSYYRDRNAHNDFLCPASGNSVRIEVIDKQMDSLVESLNLDPSWKERIIMKLSSYCEHEQMLKQKKHLEEKLRRLAKAYVDGVVGEGEYNVQRKLLQDALNSLVIPEADATIDAGQLLESLGIIWNKATLEEKHTILTGMLEAVYVDLGENKSIVGIQPKPAFYPLFESLKQGESKIMVFNPLETRANSLENRDGMVEAREGRTPRPEKSCQNFYRHSLHFAVTRSASAGGV